MEQQARSLVDMEVLLRAEDEAQELKLQVEKAELETSKMRQNLAESWVTDAADGLIGDEMAHLEEMERNLRWLMKTQQAADTERQLVERLERKEGTLQKRLREVSEEKATLASARVDLGDAGKAMRETMASQSEGYVRQLTGLEEARRIAFSERVKLMQDWDGGLWMAYGWLGLQLGCFEHSIVFDLGNVHTFAIICHVPVHPSFNRWHEISTA